MANVTVANTDAQLSAKTLITADGTQTLTGVKTFDLDPSAPFVVTSGSAKVTNLDADKLDGQEGTYYQDLTNATNPASLPLSSSAFTPTLTNGSVGNGTLVGRYIQLGKLVYFHINLTFGTTTAISGVFSLSFPVAATANGGGTLRVVMGEAFDNSATQYWDVRGRLTNGTTFSLWTGDAASSAQLTTGSPFTWATSDELHVTGVYEAA